MKVYIWNDPWNVWYGSSELVVVARDLDEARALAASGATDGRYAKHPPPKVHIGDREPDRVFDVPCAVSFEWSE